MSNEKTNIKPPRLPSAADHSFEAVARRRDILSDIGVSTQALSGEMADLSSEEVARSIEGFTGYARVPVGIFGPLPITGEEANGNYYVPIATTEGALVQSYQHVTNAVGRSGGFRTRCTDHIVWRAPAYAFANLEESTRFANWLEAQRSTLDELTCQSSGHCKLVALTTSVLGREVYVRFGFDTGDAAGQNMVTKVASVICAWLLENMPQPPEHWQIEANFSGDKKTTVLALQTARGKRASAESLLSDKLCRRYFRTGATNMARAWGTAATGSVMSGTVGSQANSANALAGLFIACGQDVACVAEASTTLTRAETTADGDLYVSVTLPNLIVGTVGGGTYLPTSNECLAMLNCLGDGKAKRFAEICAAVVLTGEIALMGAMAGGSYATAHAAVGERK